MKLHCKNGVSAHVLEIDLLPTNWTFENTGIWGVSCKDNFETCHVSIEDMFKSSRLYARRVEITDI